MNTSLYSGDASLDRRYQPRFAKRRRTTTIENTGQNLINTFETVDNRKMQFFENEMATLQMKGDRRGENDKFTKDIQNMRKSLSKKIKSK